MILFRQAVTAFVLVTLTLVMQSAGMAALIQWLKDHYPKDIRHMGRVRSGMLVVRFTSLLVTLHMLEILLWAAFYRWKCFPAWEAAFYYSAANYSTLGAADLILQSWWRTMGPVESVTGMLMCGISVSFIFALVTRMLQRHDPELVSTLAGSSRDAYEEAQAARAKIAARSER